MKEQIVEIIRDAAPLIAGVITSIIIPISIRIQSVKRLNKKIDEVKEGTQLVEINKQLKEIKKEILEMRGKRR